MLPVAGGSISCVQGYWNHQAAINWLTLLFTVLLSPLTPEHPKHSLTSTRLASETPMSLAIQWHPILEKKTKHGGSWPQNFLCNLFHIRIFLRPTFWDSPSLWAVPWPTWNPNRISDVCQGAWRLRIPTSMRTTAASEIDSVDVMLENCSIGSTFAAQQKYTWLCSGKFGGKW